MYLSGISLLSGIIGIVSIGIGYFYPKRLKNVSKEDPSITIHILESSHLLIVGGFLLIFLGLLIEVFRTLTPQ